MRSYQGVGPPFSLNRSCIPFQLFLRLVFSVFDTLFRSLIIEPDKEPLKGTSHLVGDAVLWNYKLLVWKSKGKQNYVEIRECSKSWDVHKTFFLITVSTEERGETWV